MALVIQNKPTIADFVPYERPPQPYTLWSAIPRGLQSFIVSSDQLEAKPVNDTFLLNITLTLPPNFAYVMADMNIGIIQDRAVDWDNKCNLNVQNFYRANVTLSVGLASNWLQEFPTNAADDTQRTNLGLISLLPTYPIIGSQGTSGALIVASMWNNNATVAATGTINAYFSFWQFDLEQVRKYPINAPVPVHSR